LGSVEITRAIPADIDAVPESTGRFVARQHEKFLP